MRISGESGHCFNHMSFGIQILFQEPHAPGIMEWPEGVHSRYSSIDTWVCEGKLCYVMVDGSMNKLGVNLRFMIGEGPQIFPNGLVGLNRNRNPLGMDLLGMVYCGWRVLVVTLHLQIHHQCRVYFISNLSLVELASYDTLVTAGNSLITMGRKVSIRSFRWVVTLHPIFQNHTAIMS